MTTQSKTSIENCILKGREVYWPERNGHVGKIMLDVFKESPDIVAMIDSATGESLKYIQLANQSIRCALWLKEENIAGGDVISICSLTSIPLYVSFFATLYVGGIVSVCPSQQPLENLKHYFSTVRPKIVFSMVKEAEKVLSILKEENLVHTKVIIFGNLSGLKSFNEILEKQSLEAVENVHCSNVNSHDTAILLMSSGSTGMPKSIEHSYEGLKYLIAFCTFECDDVRNILLSWITPLSGLTGMLMTFSGFLTDSTILIMNPRNMEEMCQIIEKYMVQEMFLTGDVVQNLAVFDASAKYNLSSMLHLLIAGAKARVEALEAIKHAMPKCAIIIHYGTTEIGGTVLTEFRYKKSEYIGKVTWNTKMKVVDLKTGDSLKPHTSGELCVKKQFMMKGYYNNTNATKEIIDSEGWIHTGDLGYYNEEGAVYLLDRLKMLINYRNYLLFPSEMEYHLAKHPEVKNLVVVGLAHPLDGEHPVAFVVKKQKAKVTENDLIQLSSCLGEHKMIRGVVFVENIPYSPAGKINKLELLKNFKMSRTLP